MSNESTRVRKVYVKSQHSNEPEIFESSATTWGELRAQMSTRWEGLKAVCGNNRTTLESSQAVLPAEDIRIFLYPTKVDSGAISSYHSMSYNALRSFASKEGIKVNGSKEEILARLDAHFQGGSKSNPSNEERAGESATPEVSQNAEKAAPVKNVNGQGGKASAPVVGIEIKKPFEEGMESMFMSLLAKELTQVHISFVFGGNTLNIPATQQEEDYIKEAIIEEEEEARPLSPQEYAKINVTYTREDLEKEQKDIAKDLGIK